MDIQDALTELNLSSREAQLYTSLLELGKATPLKLANKTGLKRPTVYLDLESLRRKRLVGLAFEGKKSVYVPESPQTLLRNIQEQQRTAQEIVPLLKALENKGGNKPQIRYFDDPKDMKRVWIEELFRAKEIAFITNISGYQKQFPEILESQDKFIREGRYVRDRELYTGSKEDIAFAKQVMDDNREIRIMPKDFDYSTDIELWNNNVGMYSFTGRYLLVITDDSIAQSFRALFEQLWKVSKDPKDI
ncbi:MAG: helix-turn-helix domain-containing protein [bacterium]